MTPQTPPLVLRKRAVCTLLGISPAHLDRLRKRGDFPRAIRLGDQAIGWRRDAIENWMAERPEVIH